MVPQISTFPSNQSIDRSVSAVALIFHLFSQEMGLRCDYASSRVLIRVAHAYYAVGGVIIILVLIAGAAGLPCTYI